MEWNVNLSLNNVINQLKWLKYDDKHICFITCDYFFKALSFIWTPKLV